jgi:hypothetical protein
MTVDEILEFFQNNNIKDLEEKKKIINGRLKDIEMQLVANEAWVLDKTREEVAKIVKKNS